MTVAECIHGLVLSECEVCSPRQAPEPVRTTRPRAAAPARAARPAGTGRAPAAKAPDTRRYLVVSLAELGGLLAAPLAEEEGWRLAFDAQTSRDHAVIVSTLDDADAVQLIVVANVPARREAERALRTAGRTTIRIGVNPAWFA